MWVRARRKAPPQAHCRRRSRRRAVPAFNYIDDGRDKSAALLPMSESEETPSQAKPRQQGAEIATKKSFGENRILLAEQSPTLSMSHSKSLH